MSQNNIVILPIVIPSTLCVDVDVYIGLIVKTDSRVH